MNIYRDRRMDRRSCPSRKHQGSDCRAEPVQKTELGRSRSGWQIEWLPIHREGFAYSPWTAWGGKSYDKPDIVREAVCISKAVPGPAGGRPSYNVRSGD